MSNSVEKEEPETAILFPLDETLSKKNLLSKPIFEANAR